MEFDIRKEEGDTIISDKFKLSSSGRFYKDEGYNNYIKYTSSDESSKLFEKRFDFLIRDII